MENQLIIVRNCLLCCTATIYNNVIMIDTSELAAQVWLLVEVFKQWVLVPVRAETQVDFRWARSSKFAYDSLNLVVRPSQATGYRLKTGWVPTLFFHRVLKANTKINHQKCETRCFCLCGCKSQHYAWLTFSKPIKQFVCVCYLTPLASRNGAKGQK